jgi:hypothetical protein
LEVLDDGHVGEDLRREAFPIRRPFRLETDKPKGLVVVSVGCRGPVCAVNARTLASRVVRDVQNERRPERTTVALRAAQRRVDLVEQVRLVISRSIDALIGARRGDDAIEGVVSRPADEPLRLERGVSRPVGNIPIVFCELSLAPQKITLEIVAIGRDQTRRVEAPVDFAAEVGL